MLNQAYPDKQTAAGIRRSGTELALPAGTGGTADAAASSSSLQGLTPDEVARSRELHGSNELTQKKRQSFFRQYLSSFGDPIIKILLAALAINVIFLFRHFDWYESAGIAIAVFLATFVSTLSEYGSESAGTVGRWRCRSGRSWSGISSTCRRENGYRPTGS